MEAESKRLRPPKGHRLITRWNSEETADGYCICGNWSFPGWTSRMNTVKDSYQNHLWGLKEAKEAK